MRIRTRVAVVGGIPIVIAAAIAVIAWFLLGEADRARSGAALANAAYRDLSALMGARDDFVAAPPSGRVEQAVRFGETADAARARLAALDAVGRGGGPQAASDTTREALALYREQMGRLSTLTTSNDGLILAMNRGADRLIGLTDQARERQHASNADIIASLAERDRRLRTARDLVDRAQELRAAVADAAIEAARPSPEEEGGALLAGVRLRNAADDLAEVLRRDGREEPAGELARLVAGFAGASGGAGGGGLAAWIEREIKVHATEQRALHEEVAQLLTYSVQAAETEQATQTIAITMLKLGRRAADALAARDTGSIQAIAAESRALSATMAALPISPLIQAEMIDALERWREGLATTGRGLEDQNGVVAEMDRTAARMIAGATALDSLFSNDAERIGAFVRTILALGAALGLLLGGGAAFVVARSITRPLQSLRDRMMLLAANPAAGLLPESSRADELGAMARAANAFVREIGRRESALTRAKDQVDQALAELKQTQANLIQAEKLASLGQLVAGVAHEINTPVGIALTTSTALDREVKRLEGAVGSGRLRRSELAEITERMKEGGRLLFANLTRAVDLIYSFKQVAADQASGDRRRFEVKGWLRELTTSLGPMLRKRALELIVKCPEDLALDSYPGALAQVLTNLIANAVVHAFPNNEAGHLWVQVSLRGRDAVRITVRDDGRGIAPEHLPKVFDPFFTTGRDQGSTGLGLHIVYNLVTATLQGCLDMESEPGRGTTFTIDLPLNLADQAPAEPQTVTA